MGGKLKLVDAARLLVRPGPAIQFGVDAAKSGVIDCISPHHVGPVIQALKSARSGIAQRDLIESLIEAGLDPLAAKSLVSELREFGILATLPDHQPFVAVIGRGPLAGLLSELLRGSGCVVRKPHRGESDSHFLRFIPPEIPLVAVDRLASALTLTPAVRNGARELFVAVQLIDGHGFIGPLATHAEGPCPLCTQLHRTDVDPHWPHLLTQVPAAGGASPVTVAATASHAAALVLQRLGMASPALGHQPSHNPAGLLLQVDPFSGIQEFVIRPHDRCPACFDAKYSREFGSMNIPVLS